MNEWMNAEGYETWKEERMEDWNERTNEGRMEGMEEWNEWITLDPPDFMHQQYLLKLDMSFKTVRYLLTSFNKICLNPGGIVAWTQRNTSSPYCIAFPHLST